MRERLNEKGVRSTSTRMTKASARGELQLINWKARLFRLSFVDVLVWNVWREVRHLELLVVTLRWLHCLGRRVGSCESISQGRLGGSSYKPG